MSIDSSDQNYVLEKFRSGHTVLDCTLYCSISWDLKRKQANVLLQNKQWKELALLLTQIGYSSDLSWYYLGRSAQGLGYSAAAKTYYDKSITLNKDVGSSNCKGVINLCSGHNLPADSIYHLSYLRSHPNKFNTGAMYSLRVNGYPQDAIIKIMNIVPKFKQGISLRQGKYILKIEKDEYQTEYKNVYIRNSDKTVTYKLKQLFKDPSVYHPQATITNNPIITDIEEEKNDEDYYPSAPPTTSTIVEENSKTKTTTDTEGYFPKPPPI